jgi:hypothetical protein
MIREATFESGVKVFSIRVKMFSTKCSVQCQAMGDLDNRSEFKMSKKMTTAEYFANKIVKFAKNVAALNPNLDNDEKYLPKNLDEEIK